MKELELLVSEINSLTSKNFIVDYSSAYGGYRLETVIPSIHIFSRADSNRLPKKEFKQFLLGIIAGLKFEITL